MSIQFISCTATDCPLNCDKQCRAPYIMVDEAGKCAIRDGGPYLGKSAIENYVDLRECKCSSCSFWERNEVSQLGQCGFRADLAFSYKKGTDQKTTEGPFCRERQKQIDSPPPFSTSV